MAEEVLVKNDVEEKLRRMKEVREAAKKAGYAAV